VPFFRHLKRRNPEIHKAYEQQRDGLSTDVNQSKRSGFGLGLVTCGLVNITDDDDNSNYNNTQ